MKREYDFSKGKRGAVVPPAPGKTRITIRIDDSVIEWFRSRVDAQGGGNYQTLINDALKSHVARTEQPLEDTLRRVIREELATPRRVVAKAARPRAHRGAARGGA